MSSSDLSTGTASADDASGSVEEEFSAFYRRFITTLVGFLIWQGAPARLAADLAQEVMIKAYQRWHRIESPEAWTRTVASRELMRHSGKVDEHPVGEVRETSALVARLDALAEWESGSELLRLLDALPPRQRQVLAWNVAGYTPMEIAKELGIEPDTVRANLYKARLNVAERIANRGEDS